MTTVFAFAIFAALIWSGFKYYAVYVALVDTFPPEWRDSLTARFALSQAALSPSTPLVVQADYVASEIGGCLVTFLLSLLLFSVGEARGGWLLAAIFLLIIASTIRSARKYWENRRRQSVTATKDDDG